MINTPVGSLTGAALGRTQAGLMDKAVTSHDCSRATFKVVRAGEQTLFGGR